jgi:hypothetical protein
LGLKNGFAAYLSNSSHFLSVRIGWKYLTIQSFLSSNFPQNCKDLFKIYVVHSFYNWGTELTQIICCHNKSKKMERSKQAARAELFSNNYFTNKYHLLPLKFITCYSWACPRVESHFENIIWYCNIQLVSNNFSVCLVSLRLKSFFSHSRDLRRLFGLVCSYITRSDHTILS